MSKVVKEVIDNDKIEVIKELRAKIKNITKKNRELESKIHRVKKSLGL